MAEHQATKLTRACQVCGNEFRTEENILRKGGGKFCSMPCFRAHRRSGQVACVCLRCGKGFKVRPSIVTRGAGRYCSADCRRHRPRPLSGVECACEQCGNVFRRKQHEIESHGGRFCSKPCYYASKRIPVDRQFLDRLSEPAETGCILWLGSQNVLGYGMLCCQTNGRKRLALAHRFSFEMAHGQIPEGMQVRHLCEDLYAAGDVTYRRCVNPVHLGIGDHADNAADKVANGRQQRGEAVHCARMTADGVRSLRQDYAAGGVTQKQLSERHGISVSQVIGIIKRRSWKHIQ